MASLNRAVDAIAGAMAIWLDAHEAEHSETNTIAALRQHFESVYPEAEYHPTGIDPHLVAGLHQRGRGHAGRTIGHPRLIDLILLHMAEAEEQASERRLAKGYALIPS